MNTSFSPACPRCGAFLPQDAPEGLCPHCLAANFDSLGQPSMPGVSAPPPPIEALSPHFPQLEILSCLGRGGMGVVYKARQKSLNRMVALKLLAPEREKDPEFSDRFASEAQALAKLNHPHIVTVHDFGQAGGFFYLIMEFMDGVNLRQLLQSHKFTPEQALAVVPPLCDALQYAHDRGIVHRDIKPENLLMDKEGRIKVADFGLAKMLGDDTALEKNPVGTPRYMAPEQETHPSKVDNRADIYSLGVVFYEMLTGELPGKQLEPPSRKVQIDVRLDEVVLRALAKEPALRYPQASVFKTQVQTIAHSRKDAVSIAAISGAAKDSWGKKMLKGFLFLFAIAGFVMALQMMVSMVSGRAIAPGGAVLSVFTALSSGFAALMVLTVVSAVSQTQAASKSFRMFFAAVCAFMAMQFGIAAFTAKTGSPPYNGIKLDEGMSRPQIYEILGRPNFIQSNSLPHATAEIWRAPNWFGMQVLKLSFDPASRIVGIATARTILPRDIPFEEIVVPMPVSYWILYFGIPAVVVTGCFFVVRRMRPTGKPFEAGESASQPKPDRFWRWFAVTMAATILIPMAIVILAIFLALVIPAFSKYRSKVVVPAQQQALPAAMVTAYLWLAEVPADFKATPENMELSHLWVPGSGLVFCFGIESTYPPLPDPSSSSG